LAPAYSKAAAVGHKQVLTSAGEATSSRVPFEIEIEGFRLVDSCGDDAFIEFGSTRKTEELLGTPVGTGIGPVVELPENK